MDTITEVMVISESVSKTNFSIYDLKTGTVIFSYKEGNCGQKGLALIGEEYFLSTSIDKPVIHAHTISKSQFEECPMIVPGIVNCLATNDLGDYCAAGIKNSLYMWEVSSGRLVNVLEFHSQPLTCVRFSSDGTYIISGGKDGLVLVWMFSTIVDISPTYDKTKPYYVWMDHSAEVTDIFVGKLGLYGRVATASRDRKCNIYELESGNLLTTICTDSEITAVAMDNTEYFLMVGCSEGNIHKMNLFAARGGETQHIGSELNSTFVGHKGAITALSVSTFGKYLLSGSEDGSCIIWNMSNFANLNKLTFEGPVTNAFITLLPIGLKTEGNYFPKFPVATFKRDYEAYPSLYAVSRITDKTLSLVHTETPDNYFEPSMLNSKDEQNNLEKAKPSAQELEFVNKQLYSYALCDLVRLKPDDQ